MRILKYLVPEESTITINDPVIKVLSAKNQRNEIAVWALVDDQDVSYHRTLELMTIGTGWEVPESFFERWTFIDTVVLSPYTWHLFGRFVNDN